MHLMQFGGFYINKFLIKIFQISEKKDSHVLRHIQTEKHQENLDKGNNLKYIGIC